MAELCERTVNMAEELEIEKEESMRQVDCLSKAVKQLQD